jgi:[acyl-carrier-protein] S-malonyltransferase
MGQALAADYAVARETFEEADDLLGFGLSSLCFEGPEATLTDTVNVQPALLATSVAALRVLQQELGTLDGDGRSVFVAGHSLGEYSALVAAGSLAYGDALLLVRERGRLMKEAGAAAPGRMAAILGMDEAAVAALCARVTVNGGVVQVANDNCPGQIVISGDEAGMTQAVLALEEAGARKIVPLAVSIAAHSPLMAPAASALQARIAATPIATPIVPLIANTSATPIEAVGPIRAELAAQLTESVRWHESMQLALAHGVTRFVEIGSGSVLTGLMKRIDRKAERLAVGDPAGVVALIALLDG